MGTGWRMWGGTYRCQPGTLGTTLGNEGPSQEGSHIRATSMWGGTYKYLPGTLGTTLVNEGPSQREAT